MTERSEPNNEYDPLPALQAVAARVEEGYKIHEEERFYLVYPTGGGTGPMSLVDAVQEAIYMTTERIDVLSVETAAQEVIALFYGGFAFVQVESPIKYPIDTPCMWGEIEAVVTDVDGAEREIRYMDHGEGEYRWRDVPVSALSPLK